MGLKQVRQYKWYGIIQERQDKKIMGLKQVRQYKWYGMIQERQDKKKESRPMRQDKERYK